jgi:hypothetical protein
MLRNFTTPGDDGFTTVRLTRSTRVIEVYCFPVSPRLPPIALADSVAGNACKSRGPLIVDVWRGFTVLPCCPCFALQKQVPRWRIW